MLPPFQVARIWLWQPYLCCSAIVLFPTAYLQLRRFCRSSGNGAVCGWLRAQNTQPEVVELFRKASITGPMLLRLKPKDLIKLGLPDSDPQRAQLEQQLQELRLHVGRLNGSEDGICVRAVNKLFWPLLLLFAMAMIWFGYYFLLVLGFTTGEYLAVLSGG